MTITKEYVPVKITEEFKKDYFISRFGEAGPPPGIKISWDSHYNPFIYLSVDEEGRVFVRIYEKAPNGRYYYDIFNPHGKFIAKIPLEHSPRVWRKTNSIIDMLPF